MDVRTPRSCSCRPSTARPTLEAAPRASPSDDHPGDRRRGLWPPADCVNIDSHTCLVLLEAGHALLRPTQPLYGDGQNVRDWLYGEDHVDRPGHDRRYAIDPTRISSELGWQPRHSFEEGLAAPVRWYLEQQEWCQEVRDRAGYGGDRLGVLAGAGAN